jgi:hypothetical protein
MSRLGPWRLILLLAVLAAPLLVSRAAAAMSFTEVPLPEGRVLLRAKGLFLFGDDRTFIRHVDTLDKIRRLAVLEIDSPGGFIDVAERIAVTVHNVGIPVAVPARGLCASACVIVLAAAPQRSAGTGARIGVHRASMIQRDLKLHENGRSAGYTDSMALHFEIYGVPRSIIEKMNATAADTLAWLDRRDLAAMHVGAYWAPDAKVAAPPKG